MASLPLVGTVLVLTGVPTATRETKLHLAFFTIASVPLVTAPPLVWSGGTCGTKRCRGALAVGYGAVLLFKMELDHCVLAFSDGPVLLLQTSVPAATRGMFWRSRAGV